MGSAILITLVARYALVMLFFPFSALDKVLNFRGAVAQAREAAPGTALPILLILTGLCVEILMPLAILTGILDRLAAFVMAGYCGVTAVLWKQFWKQGDFWRGGKGRELFWDFLKNFAVAGGFLMITFGPNAGAAADFPRHPFSSTHPYSARPAP